VDERPITIKGGAGAFEAAALAVLIRHVLDEQERARSRRPDVRTGPAWVRVGREQRFGRFNPPIAPDWGRNAP
jgi:hypothetical protein